MAIGKLKSGRPFSDIRDWIWERSKTFIPNPLRPKRTKTKLDKFINHVNLQRILIDSHAPNGKINEIIDEVNDLIRRVTINEEDIDKLENRATELERRATELETKVSTLETKVTSLETQVPTKSMIGHFHASGAGPTAPSTNRKGGKLQRGGKTSPVPTSREELIKQIKRLQSNR
jgi:chromosome segregation ATPase